MEVVELKMKIRNYLEEADERILRIFNAIIESEKSELSEDQMKELEERLKAYLENPATAMDWEELKNNW